jgi:hypothetical protein
MAQPSGAWMRVDVPDDFNPRDRLSLHRIGRAGNRRQQEAANCFVYDHSAAGLG